MALAPELLAVLVCPLTREPLRHVMASEQDPECLVSERAGLVYRIEDGVPILLLEEATSASPEAIAALCQRADKPAR